MNFPGEFRRAAQADVVAIRDLTRAAYAKWVPVIGREPKPIGADYEWASFRQPKTRDSTYSFRGNYHLDIVGRYMM
jgi:hypothetical protein